MGTISYISDPAAAGAYTPGRTLDIQSIILHSSCGHQDGDLLTLTGHDPGHLVSSNWYVNKAGAYYHLVDDADTAYHAGVVTDAKYSNAASLGIEQEHLDGEENWPDVQVQATACLCVALIQRYGNLEIAHHATVAAPPGRKTDPVDFPGDVFWAAYEEAAKDSWDFAEAAQ